MKKIQTVTESFISLRDQLKQIDATPTKQLDELNWGKLLGKAAPKVTQTAPAAVAAPAKTMAQKFKGKPPVTAAVATSPAVLAKKGNLLLRIIKKNPKLAVALAAAGAGYAYKDEIKNAAQTASQSIAKVATTPTPASDVGQSGQTRPENNENELAALKARIDALSAEIGQSQNQTIKTELSRIMAKMN